MADITVYSEQPQTEYRFNPNEHLMQIKNKGGASDYLPVQWRLVWFRSLCPNGTIETEIVLLDLDKDTEEEIYAWNNDTHRSEKIIKRAPGIAIFRATVKDGKGGVAIGTKSEKAASFPDFIEKAETGAIGRALAGLGYGTQFAPELDEQHRIVDAPVENRAQPVRSNQANATGRTQSRQPTPAEQDAYKQRRKVVDADPVAQQKAPTMAEVFQVGMRKKSWEAKEFYAAAGAILGIRVTKESVLTPEQLKKLMEAAEQGPVEQPV